MRFQMLIPRCQGSPLQLNVDRRRVPAASRWNQRWPSETGSGNNFACIIGRNAISNANITLSRVANTMKHRPTRNTSYVYVQSKMADGKPEVAITLLVLQIERRSQTLILCFQGSPTRWTVDRHRILAAFK
jgi:hypothetical protein